MIELCIVEATVRCIEWQWGS